MIKKLDSKMYFFVIWAFSGIIVMLLYIASTLESAFFTYNKFEFVLFVWISLGFFATWDIVLFIKAQKRKEKSR